MLSYSFVRKPLEFVDTVDRRSFDVMVTVEGDEILQVHGERTQGVVKTLMNKKVDEPNLRDISVVQDLLMCFLKICRCTTTDGHKVVLPHRFVHGADVSCEGSEELGSTYDTIRDMIILRIGRSKCKERYWLLQVRRPRVQNFAYHPGKANVVTDALSRKEQVKPRRVRAMAMTIQYGVPLVGSEMDEAHTSRLRWMIYLVVLADAAESVRDTIGFEYCLASSSGWTKIGPVAYQLRLPDELSSVHDTFHVLNLKKCLADENLHVPLNEIKIDKTLHFVEELIEIMDREIRNLKRSKIPLGKVHWNSMRGPEFTWEGEDHMKSKYP
ncbi:hypothetical protein Tco_0513509 [Tanacetum coccineum]